MCFIIVSPKDLDYVSQNIQDNKVSSLDHELFTPVQVFIAVYYFVITIRIMKYKLRASGLHRIHFRKKGKKYNGFRLEF